VDSRVMLKKNCFSAAGIGGADRVYCYTSKLDCGGLNGAHYKLYLHPPMLLAEKQFFFSMTLESTCFGLKCVLYDVRGRFLVYTSVLAFLAAFTAFQELINCCKWWCLQQKVRMSSLQRIMWVWEVYGV